jgi:ABC-type sugar transport system ATPase subunit
MVQFPYGHVADPFAGLDPFDRLAGEGKAVVVISSYLSEIMTLSDRALVCRQGKVVEQLAVREATEESIIYAAIR